MAGGTDLYQDPRAKLYVPVEEFASCGLAGSRVTTANPKIQATSSKLSSKRQSQNQN